MRLKHCILYTLEKGENPYDIRDGKHNDLIVRQAIADAHRYTLQNVPPLQERGFRIEIRARVVIALGLYMPKVAESVKDQPAMRAREKAKRCATSANR